MLDAAKKDADEDLPYFSADDEFIPSVTADSSAIEIDLTNITEE